ncbi:MAG: N-6 DNA methylase [Gammaproteobacteria bacterium]|nr:N-6 DNA methylase [Gammaproteobacteria bacterium]
MLDSDTKRRIDTCRDILVGKVPDPKSQVEQITIALIYKFMDDMDAEAEELGGDRSFFTGEFARYGWSKLMAPGLGGHEMLSLYAEAIQRMNENPGIPPLFRDIFKNAFLPYRDPETLRSFLKEINSFTYDHSERLGDAFEYLLSVLGSQGEAGQFRTPRHIIDFMVELIDPKKDETILDPACGTAGFLISSYKHILKHNTKEYREQQDREAYDEKGVPIEELPIDNPMRYSGDLLTPDDRKRLAANIVGYDISPDMVRLSLVNMYLHGFTDPHIEEYDTLTSDEKWSELADVILANPPFMSPKGGIKPHKRFSVQSKRSEVLFVDYIAEHLTPNGRAAVVVPEGIIFQSQTAYRQLREMLVKSYLVAVISLPAGVFNPYSGVKTSILVLDKRLAKQRDEVLFVKVENDGFNLGAQRRPINKNDLPEAVRSAKAFLHQGEVAERKNVLGVSREQIGGNGEWNLSGDRYGIEDTIQSDFDFVPICELGSVVSGSGFPKDMQGMTKEQYPFLKVSDMNISGNEMFIKSENNTVSEEVLKELNAKAYPAGTVIFPKIGAAIATNKKRILTKPSAFDNNVMGIVPNEGNVSSLFLYYMLQRVDLSEWASNAQPPSMRKTVVEAYKLPMPPLEVQKEIVAEIEGYQKIIDGARQVVENYQPRIPIHPDWPMVGLGEVAENLDSKRVPITKGDRKEGPYPYYGASGIVDHVDGYIFDEDLLLISEDGANLLARSTPIAFSVSGKVWVNNHAHVLRFEEMATQKFVEIYLNSIPLDSYVTGAAQPKLNQKALNSITIPLPDIDEQISVVADLEEDGRLVNCNKELIQRFEEKIKQTINRVWGETE